LGSKKGGGNEKKQIKKKNEAPVLEERKNQNKRTVGMTRGTDTFTRERNSESAARKRKRNYKCTRRFEEGIRLGDERKSFVNQA